MNYQRQNFKDGDVLYGKNLNYIEDGILDLYDIKADIADVLFKFQRTGRVYTVKIPRFSSNQTTTCEKLDDNAGLVCEPSTDTTEGRDDYENIPLFKWYNCNYLRDKNGHAYPVAIEGLSEDYRTDGSVDVGVIQMTPYVKWDESNTAYTLLSITDMPKEGFTPWSTAVSDGVTYPYVIHSKYISGIASDGLLRSQPNLKPARNQSHNNIIANYAKKGDGYTGAGIERNTWQIVFTLIKYANKSSQNVFAGVTNYSFQYSASIQRSENLTYFPVTTAQAANIQVGNYVSVGYGAISGSSITTDRGYGSVHVYADDVKVLRIDTIDTNNRAVYLDVQNGFNTTSVTLSSALTAPIILTSMHSWSGTTDSVKLHHDGSPVNNTSGKNAYRIQGVEYAVGGYVVMSDTVGVFDSQNGKDIYVCPRGTKHSASDSVIISSYKNIGNVPSGDFWIGDIGLDVETSATWPKTKGSGSSTGVGDYVYGGGNASRNAVRECLLGGSLWAGSDAGSSYLGLWAWLGGEGWGFLSAD